jgi:hypothetical protein
VSRRYLSQIIPWQNKRNITSHRDLYYACAVDITVLMALSSIAIKQTKGMTKTMAKAKQLLTILLQILTRPFISEHWTRS